MFQPPPHPPFIFPTIMFLTLRAVQSKNVSSCCSCCSHVFVGRKCCPSVINHSSLRVLFFDIKNFAQFSLAPENCPSARCAATANLVCGNQIFAAVSLCHINL